MAEKMFRISRVTWETHGAGLSAVRFAAEPGTLWAVIRAFWGEGGHAPNAGHLALATLPGLQAIVTQNVFDPMAPDDPAMGEFRRAFIRMHALARLREVCALHGTASGELEDPWTIWSFQRQPPDPGPEIEGVNWSTPYDRG